MNSYTQKSELRNYSSVQRFCEHILYSTEVMSVDWMALRKFARGNLPNKFKKYCTDGKTEDVITDRCNTGSKRNNLSQQIILFKISFLLHAEQSWPFTLH